MSTLRQRLTRPGSYLLLLSFVIALVAADSLRPPGRQVFARLYVASVHAYQHFGRPLLEGRVRCRYNPTCSNYSEAAVRKYGLAKGLALTAARLWHCRGSVALGTLDPVP
jgi:putative component of membrane protein insertase Oxa1/YidC/SpoIIIJ protein YidD